MDERQERLARLDREHVWHPFTPMRQWRQREPLIIERAEGTFLIDTAGNRYIDGVSSLWCNVHGHRVPEIDRAIREQLDQVAHTTLLGLANVPSIELAAELVVAAECLQSSAGAFTNLSDGPLRKVFYSDAGATALEVAFKMAVGYWHHRSRPRKHMLIGLAGAYHGDTVGSMSVGFSELFHRPFASMVFPVLWAPAPDAVRLGPVVPNVAPSPRGRGQGEGSALQPGTQNAERATKQDPQSGSGRPLPRGKREVEDPRPLPGVPLPQAGEGGGFPSQEAALSNALREHCLRELDALLRQHTDEVAAVVIEPVMQGAAGMICQPPGFVRGVADLARRHGVLLIADEVATAFGRTGTLFACASEGVTPDILCLAKGITGGYLPLAATLATEEVEDAFTGEPAERRTLYHGHTYTGNPLACAAALASLRLYHDRGLERHIAASAAIVAQRLAELRDHPHVLDIRQRGLMVGIELCRDRASREPFDFSRRTAAALCDAMRPKGLIIRPLGDVLVLMPIPAMDHATLHRMLDIVLETLTAWRYG